MESNNVQYVSIAEFERQRFEVEGVAISITQFNPELRKKLDKIQYPSYPYTTKFNGDEVALVNQRISPLLSQYKIKE